MTRDPRPPAVRFHTFARQTCVSTKKHRSALKVLNKEPLQIVPIDLQDWLESPGGADIPVRFMATGGTDAPRPDSGIAYSALND